MICLGYLFYGYIIASYSQFDARVRFTFSPEIPMHHERKQYSTHGGTGRNGGMVAASSIHAGRQIPNADARNSHVCIASSSDSRLRTLDYLSITFVSLPKTSTARTRASLYRVQLLTAHFGTFACFSIRQLRYGSRVASNIILPRVRGSD